MAVTEAFTASQTVSTTQLSCVNGSSTIATNTTAGAYQLWLDLNALAAGDEFRIRLLEKVRSADTQRIAAEWSIMGAQSQPDWVSPAFMLINGWDFTLLKVAGTDRTITSSIRKAA